MVRPVGGAPLTRFLLEADGIDSHRGQGCSFLSRRPIVEELSTLTFGPLALVER